MQVGEVLKPGLVVSCQAEEHSPLYGPMFMTAMAKAAEIGGAAGVRVNGPVDLAAVRKAVQLPIIGIYKRRDLDPDVYITPSLAEVEVLVRAGANIVAVDATLRPRRYGSQPAELIHQIKQRYPAVLVMADVSTLNEGLQAAEVNVDIIATTLSGYTPYSRQMEEPDLQLVEELVRDTKCTVVAEGRYGTPQKVAEAFARGAYAVVVGTAITNPLALVERFASAVPSRAEP